MSPIAMRLGFDNVCAENSHDGLELSQIVQGWPIQGQRRQIGNRVSVGGRGFRTGVRASGRRYSSVSLPGTGLRYTKPPVRGPRAAWWFSWGGFSSRY